MSNQAPGPETTLEEAKRWLLAALEDGEVVSCPTCTLPAKVYERQIYATMAKDLIKITRKVPHGEWFHMPTIQGGVGGDVSKLRYWGLIEQPPEGVRPDGSKRTGFWRVTDEGREYVLGLLMVQKYAVTYGGVLLHTKGPLMSIRDSLRDKFDYDELMSR